MPTKADSAWEDRVSNAGVLIRVLVGWVFLSEGIQKFLFLKIGTFPLPVPLARLRGT